MTAWLTDKRFLVGLAVGYLVLPRAAGFVMARVSAMRAPAPTSG